MRSGTRLAVLKRLQPRLYSISSSPKAEPNQVHLTVSTVRYAFENKKYGGVCSTFLADRAVDAEVPIFVRKLAHFRLPKDPDAPIIKVKSPLFAVEDHSTVMKFVIGNESAIGGEARVIPIVSEAVMYCMSTSIFW